jgi:hypothetical protein
MMGRTKWIDFKDTRQVSKIYSEELAIVAKKSVSRWDEIVEGSKKSNLRK